MNEIFQKELDYAHELMERTLNMPIKKPSIREETNSKSLPAMSFEVNSNTIYICNLQKQDQDLRMYMWLSRLGYVINCTLNNELTLKNIYFLIRNKKTEMKGKVYDVFDGSMANYLATLAATFSEDSVFQTVSEEIQQDLERRFTEWLSSDDFKGLERHFTGKFSLPLALTNYPSHIRTLYSYFSSALWRTNREEHAPILGHYFTLGLDNKFSGQSFDDTKIDLVNMIRNPPETALELVCPDLYWESFRAVQGLKKDMGKRK